MPERTTAGGAATLTELLRGQADRQHDRVAFHFCPDGDAEEARLTYAELDLRARAIAAALQARGAAGRRVLVICRPGLDGIAGIFGCFYAGAVAVPVDDHWISQRFEQVVPDAQAEFVLATAKSEHRWRATVDRLAPDRPLRWLGMDSAPGDARDWVTPRIDPDATAMLQYTSGSTGAPKGVMLSHRNLLNNLAVGEQTWNPGPDDPVYASPVTGLTWLPQYQQMGLVGGVFGLVYSGGTGVLMAPGSFLVRPIRWLQAMSRFRAVVSAAPNFAYDWCVKRSTEAERAELDLSHWTVAAVGGEPVRADTLRAFAEAFAPAGFRPESFRPGYGQAETTLGLTGTTKRAAPAVYHVDRAALGEHRVVGAAPGDPGAAAVVSCGRPPADHEVLLVDPETRERCEPGRVGEVWAAGGSIAGGYWHKPELTARTFAARLASGEGPYLRTGDLAFWHDDELFVTGRMGDLIEIDGYKHYPNDIESTVQAAHPALLPNRGAAFTATPTGQAQRLVVVQEVQRNRVEPAELPAVIDAVRAAVTRHHGVDVHDVVLVKPMRMPTTPTGKIQRNQCREQFLAGTLDAVTDWHAPPVQLDAHTKNVREGVARGLGVLIAGAVAAKRKQRGTGP